MTVDFIMHIYDTVYKQLSLVFFKGGPLNSHCITNVRIYHCYLRKGDTIYAYRNKFFVGGTKTLKRLKNRII
jgi:hypothetical protein